MTPLTSRRTAAAIVATIVASEAALGGRDTTPVRPDNPYEDRALVERGVLLVRLDPKRGAPAGSCNALSERDIVVTLGGAPATITSVERVPRPERHWLLLDISGSAEARREESKRSAQKYVRAVMDPLEDAATLVAIDDDVVLASALSTDPAALAARIGEIPAGGGSALRDGLDTVLRQIEGDRHEQLILYWTDGQDNLSLASLDDLLATVDRTPHAAVFPIVIPSSEDGSSKGSRPFAPMADQFLFGVAQRSGGEVLGAWDSGWLDRVRGWISRRFVVSVAYPQGSSMGRPVVSVRNKNCVATLLRDPFARPDPIAGAAAPAPATWVRYHAKHKTKDDPACSGGAGSQSWEWPWHSEGDALAGCLLDRIRPPVLFAAREVRVLAPPIEALPTSLGDVIELLASPGDKRSPLWVSGSALLTQRANIAASLFAERRDYRDFALARLAELANGELRAIERSLAHDYPDLSPDAIAAAARASRTGRRTLDAARNPTDADLAKVLTAWLSDVPARSLFTQWEIRLIDAWIDSGPDPTAPAKWAALRARIVRDEGYRVAAPLILIKDPGRRLIGFSRIELPRLAAVGEPPANPIPVNPLALLVVDRIAGRSGIRDRLAAGGYRTTKIQEDSTVPAWRAGVGDPYRRARVIVVFESQSANARAEIEAEVATGDDGAMTVACTKPTVTGDPELASLFRDAGPVN